MTTDRDLDLLAQVTMLERIVSDLVKLQFSCIPDPVAGLTALRDRFQDNTDRLFGGTPYDPANLMVSKHAERFFTVLLDAARQDAARADAPK